MAERHGMFGRIMGKLFPSRQAPARADTQARHVRDRLFNGSTKAMAQAYGVTPRAVQRYLSGERAPKGDLAKRLESDAARVQVTPTGRERRARQLGAAGKAPSLRVRVGSAKSSDLRIGGSERVRSRDLDLDLSGTQAAALARAKDEDAMSKVIQGAVADYFNAGARHAGLEASDIEFGAGDVDLI